MLHLLWPCQLDPTHPLDLRRLDLSVRPLQWVLEPHTLEAQTYMRQKTAVYTK